MNLLSGTHRDTLSAASLSGVTSSPSYAEVIQGIPFYLVDSETLRSTLLDHFRNFPDVSEKKLDVAARALKLVFESNPLHSSGGYFQHALVQFLVCKSLRDKKRSSMPIRALLGIMDRGLSLKELEAAFSVFDYDTNLSISSDPKPSLGGVYRWYQNKGSLKKLSEEDQRLVINYAYRNVRPTDAREEDEKKRTTADRTVQLFSAAIAQYYGINWVKVFEWIRNHPTVNLLAFQRLKNLFSIYDSKGHLIQMPHKVRDIVGSGVKSAEGSFTDWPDISDDTLWALNATDQIAYIEDPRLARRVALVKGEWDFLNKKAMEPDLHPVVRAVRDRFERGYQACVHRGYLEEGDLLAPFLGESPLPYNLGPLRDIIPKIGIRLVSQDDFNKIKAQVPGLPPACRLAFYVASSGTLFVEKLPQDMPPDSPRGRHAFLERAVAVAHELVHAVQSQPVMHRGKPIFPYHDHYPDRLVSEAEAGLVDGLVEFLYQGPVALPVAKALGLSLTHYFILRRERLAVAS